MKIAFSKQSTNPDKHPDMPGDYPFEIYEIEDARETEFSGLGFEVMTPEDFEAYKAGFDLTAYNAAIAPTSGQVYEKFKAKFLDIVAQQSDDYGLWCRSLGIAPPTTLDVINYLHKYNHLVEVVAITQAKALLDQMIEDGIPSGLAPFVTESVLLQFKANLDSAAAEASG